MYKIAQIAVFLDSRSCEVLSGVVNTWPLQQENDSCIRDACMVMSESPGMDMEGEMYPRLGEEVELEPYRMHSDGRGNQALEVGIPGGLFSGDYPHITLARSRWYNTGYVHQALDMIIDHRSREATWGHRFGEICSDVWPVLRGRIGFRMVSGRISFSKEDYWSL